MSLEIDACPSKHLQLTLQFHLQNVLRDFIGKEMLVIQTHYLYLDRRFFAPLDSSTMELGAIKFHLSLVLRNTMKKMVGAIRLADENHGRKRQLQDSFTLQQMLQDTDVVQTDLSTTTISVIDARQILFYAKTNVLEVGIAAAAAAIPTLI
jgi:hypothetical protein